MHTHNWQPRLIQLLTLPGLLIAYYLWLYHEGQIISACTVTNFFFAAVSARAPRHLCHHRPHPRRHYWSLRLCRHFSSRWAADFLPFIKKHLPELLVGLIGFALLFTLYLKALEIFVIGVICQYCLYSAIIIAIMFALAIHYLIRGRRIEAA
ncbi:MAG: hypothetical protein IPL28_20560 [Chloroflexi bacterium]|nr:hypothetical protein [Chloroflexota bacterium]